MPWEHILKIASEIHDPVTVAVFAAVLLVAITYFLLHAKKPQTKALLGILIVAIFFLGVGPLVATTFLKVRGLYHVRVTVLGPDQIPVTDADVTSSVGEQPKTFEGGWEFDIPPQTRPADGKIVFRAIVRSAFLTGKSTIVLDNDYYPTTAIQLTADSSASVRGIVVDERNRPVEGATVSVTGYPDSVTTGKNGNFELPAHAADGQIVQVRAQKGQLFGDASGPAGRGIITIIVKQR
jgi:hypothetical protein